MAGFYSAVDTKQERLTDLFVEGTINQDAFKLRQDNLAFDMEHLRGELKALQQRRFNLGDYKELLLISVSLQDAYENADIAAKRQLLRNTFAKMELIDGELICMPADWLRGIAKADMANLDAEPIHTALRELGLQNIVRG